MNDTMDATTILKLTEQNSGRIEPGTVCRWSGCTQGEAKRRSGARARAARAVSLWGPPVSVRGEASAEPVVFRVEDRIGSLRISDCLRELR